MKQKFTTRQKLIGTAGCLFLYRALSFIPLPYADRSYIKLLIGSNGSLGFLNILSGGSLGNLSFMALGIGPWITVSIVMQLLGGVFPKLKEMPEDAYGKRNYKLITFVLAAALAIMESVGIMASCGAQGYLSEHSTKAVLIPAILMAAGSGILSLMGWFMDEKLFGNGTSLILTAGILSSYVSDLVTSGHMLVHGKNTANAVFSCAAWFLAVMAMFLFVVFFLSCEKQIPVSYSKSGGNMGHIPMRLAGGGVMPVIFASTIITFPSIVGAVAGYHGKWLFLFDMGRWFDAAYPWASFGFVLYIALILGFEYFCRLMYENPVEISMNLQENGGIIPWVRSGKPTADYLKKHMVRLTLLGGIFLSIIAAVPAIVSGIFHIGNLSFLGTGVLIVVSSIDELWKAWETEKRFGMHTAKSIF